MPSVPLDAKRQAYETHSVLLTESIGKSDPARIQDGGADDPRMIGVGTDATSRLGLCDSCYQPGT